VNLVYTRELLIFFIYYVFYLRKKARITIRLVSLILPSTRSLFMQLNVDRSTSTKRPRHATKSFGSALPQRKYSLPARIWFVKRSYEQRPTLLLSWLVARKGKGTSGTGVSSGDPQAGLVSPESWYAATSPVRFHGVGAVGRGTRQSLLAKAPTYSCPHMLRYCTSVYPSVLCSTART
jgi:hypothetical protein